MLGARSGLLAMAVGALVVGGVLLGAPGAEKAAASTKVEVVNAEAASFFQGSRVGTQERGGAKRVVGIVDLIATGGGLFCGTCDDEYGFYTLRMGGRVHARLVKLPAVCPARPGQGGVTVVGSPKKPYVDVPAARYRIVGDIPASRLSSGRWRLCSWFEFSPSFAVSNPVYPGSLPGFAVPEQVAGPFRSAKTVRVP